MSKILTCLPNELLEALDIPLAIRRVRRDMRDDWFVDPLRYRDILTEKSWRAWAEGFLKPVAAEVFNIPKPGFVVRAASEVFLHERILYQAIADLLVEEYDSLLRNECVFSHRLRPGREDYIFLNSIEAWKDYDTQSRDAVCDSNPVIVQTDIQNFFECISINRICELFKTESPNATGRFTCAIDVLKSLLNGWHPRGIGLPQNRDPSSFLANVYLRGVDEFMALRGYSYFRFMDDIRIVCSTPFEARRALQDLVIKLRELDLRVNSKKTLIVAKDDKDFEKLLPPSDRRLEQIDEMFRARSVQSVSKAIPLLETLAMELITSKKTNSKEFRFCIARIERLARCSDIAYDASGYVDEATRLLIEEPWSTDTLCRLLRSATIDSTQQSQIANLVTCKERNIYEWQAYLLWQLVAILNPVGSRDLLRRAARASLRDPLAIPFKAGAILYLGCCGDVHDREYLLESGNEHPNSNMLQRALAIATRRATTESEKALRRAILPEIYADELLERNDDRDFFAPLPRISASRIYDDLPSFYV